MRATPNVKLCAGDHVVTKIKNTWHRGISTSEDFATFCSTGTFLSIDVPAIIPKNPPRKRLTMNGIFDSLFGTVKECRDTM